jgi:hypothetical protein
VVCVEGVVGEGLDVLQVGGVAGGAGSFKGVDDVVAGMIEDPFSVGRREGSMSVRFGLTEQFVGNIPDPEHAGPSVLGLLES